MFYRVTCRDNGCGVHREAIPDAFGRVLAGSKYGARQALGKFDLGAKMALIWGKKSSGLPLTVRTARAAHEPVSRVVLDIDIQRNEPRVLEDSVAENSQKWRGAELTVTVGGNWKAYRARIVQYLRQLAIITPYASLRLDFRGSGPTGGRAPGVRAADDEGAPRAPGDGLPPRGARRAAAGAAAAEDGPAVAGRVLPATRCRAGRPRSCGACSRRAASTRGRSRSAWRTTPRGCGGSRACSGT